MATKTRLAWAFVFVWVIYLAIIGPFLLSAESDIAVILAIGIFIAMVYATYAVFNKAIRKLLNEIS